MDFRKEFPDYVAIEKFVRQARAERSLYLGNLIANAIVAAWNALKAFADRTPLRGSKVQWGPHPVSKASIAPD